MKGMFMSDVVYDYHRHSTASDGALTPTELVHRAAAAGVNSFALTDHDTVAGLAEAEAAAKALGMEFISGVELSVGWADRKSTRLNSSHVSISYAVFCL